MTKAFGVAADSLDEAFHFIVKTTGEFRVSVMDDEVSVSCVASLASMESGADHHDVAQLIDEIVQMADEYRRTLADTFDAVPRFESSAR